MTPLDRKRVGNMAESRSVFSKVVSKHAGRAKERFLQNLGKADKTTDEIFNTYVNNFNKQQVCATKLQKELKNYVTCVRAMQAASKALMDTVSEIYEAEWIGHEQLPVKAQGLELIWDDFGHKLLDQLTIPLNNYLSQFSEIRNKISKRGRKLVDYDSCRHNVEALSHGPKKREEIKIIKAKEQLEEAKGMYDVINNELQEELPALYDSRIPFFVSNMQTLFTAEMVFHSENTKIYSQLSDLMEKLTVENQRGSYFIHRSESTKIPRGENETRHYEEVEFKKCQQDNEQTTANGDPHSPVSPTKHVKESQNGSLVIQNTSPISLKDDKEYDPVEIQPEGPLLANENHVLNDTRSPSPTSSPKPASPKATPTAAPIPEPTPPELPAKESASVQKNVEELYDIPVGATTTDLPPGTLYRVRATYKYIAEDVDELAFETGELIRVIEYEDPGEQEEGWLMGVKESTGDKGLFPANFTRPI